MFTLKNKETILGILKRYPEPIHNYWYVITKDESALIAIREDSILTIYKLGPDALKEVEEIAREIEKQIQEEKDKLHEQANS